jgi:hypothetical protein
MPPLNTGNHEIEASFHVDNKHEEGDDVPPSTTSSRKADIRNELCRLQVRCEDLEQDRNYHAVKASELQEILEAHLFDDVQDTLMKKSMQIAEASMGVDRGLHLHIRKLEAEINRMKTERETERANMMDLSGIVRSLQSSCQESDEEEEEDEVFLAREIALDMTLKHMKFQIEFLENERQKMALKGISQARTIEILKKDSELKQVKIEMLEELFRSLNSEERSSSCQQAQETTTVTKPALEKTAAVTKEPVLEKTKNMGSRLPTLKSKIISICRLKKMNSAPVLSTTSKEAGVLSSLKGTSIDPNSNARRMEIKIGDLEGQYNGPLRNSVPHGTGTIRFRNGDTYLGELVDGEMHGNGTLYHRSKDSGISRGYFEHNTFVGVETEGPLRKRR